MEISEHGLHATANFEKFMSKPYLDASPKRIPTIGFGTTHYPNGTAVTINDAPITIDQAYEYMKHDMNNISKDLNNLVNHEKLNQNQFDALAIFCYNVGCHNFDTSTLRKEVEANPDNPDIRYQFSRWNKSGGQVLAGLTNRRKAESDLYFNGGNFSKVVEETQHTDETLITKIIDNIDNF